MSSDDNSLAGIMKLPDSTRVGSPVLRTKNLDRMLDFYQGVFGLEAKRSSDSGNTSVALGFGRRKKEKFSDTADPLLILKHDPEARETQHNFAGLYHFAILVPDRKSLAQAYLGVQRGQVQFDGFGDHLVSESLYLHDPEHNGIEIYRDRPRNEWTYDNRNGRIVMGTLPLDLGGILGELSEDEGRQTLETFPNGARIGHMHLRVTNLERSVKFYHERLGFDVSVDLSSMGAVFLSAGEYHHHIGLNTWHSLGGKRHETGEAGLEQFTVELPHHDSSLIHTLESRLEGTKIGESELLASDPDGIPVAIKSG